MRQHTRRTNAVFRRDILLGADLRDRIPHYAAILAVRVTRSFTAGQAAIVGLLALDWFLMVIGLAAGLRTVQTGKLAGSPSQLPASGLTGIALIFAGGLLLALSLRSIGWLRSSVVTRVIMAGLVTIIITDVPWLVAMALTAVHRDLHAFYRMGFDGAQIAIGSDALTVLVLSLGGCLLLTRRLRRLSVLIRSLILGGGMATGVAALSRGAMLSGWSGTLLWAVVPLVAAIGIMYVIARQDHVDQLFTTREVLQLQELRQRYRRGSV